MKKFKKNTPNVIEHVADTWLLANGIHVVILAIIWWSAIFSMGWNSIGITILVIMIVAALSLPCLVMAYFCLGIIVRGISPVITLFITWMVVCPCIVLLEGVLFEACLRSKDYLTVPFVPAMVSALLAVIIRYRQFKKLITHYQSYVSV